MLLMIPAAFAAAVFLVHAQLLWAPRTIATDLAQPLPVATTWHDFGKALWVAVFGCMAVAAIPYLLLLQKLLRRMISAPSLWVVAAISALSLAAALCMPVIF